MQLNCFALSAAQIQHEDDEEEADSDDGGDDYHRAAILLCRCAFGAITLARPSFGGATRVDTALHCA
jgi:hypothetical protein